jgi:hypothetical protein
VTDEKRAMVAVIGLIGREKVTHVGADADGTRGSVPIARQPRGDHPVPVSGKLGSQMSPGVWGIGEAVHHYRQWVVVVVYVAESQRLWCAHVFPFTADVDEWFAFNMLT